MGQSRTLGTSLQQHINEVCSNARQRGTAQHSTELCSRGEGQALQAAQHRARFLLQRTAAVTVQHALNLHLNAAMTALPAPVLLVHPLHEYAQAC